MGERKRLRRAWRQIQSGKKSAGSAKRRGWTGASSYARTLALEPLEDRRVLATFLVTNLLDGDPGSLRAAVDAANGNDNPNDTDFILFADGLAGVIPLDDGQIDIEESVRIISPTSAKIAVQADINSRIFFIDIGDEEDFFDVEISGLTLFRGNMRTGDIDERLGGAIWNKELLVMRETVITDSHADAGGGAIYHEMGQLFMDRCIVGLYANSLFRIGFNPGDLYYGGNTAGGVGGGGILIGPEVEDALDTAEDLAALPRATIVSSTLSGNFALAGGVGQGYGGGILNRSGFTYLGGNTIINNIAQYGGGVGSWGNFPPEAPENPDDPPPDPPPSISMVTISSNIIFGNTADDIAVVGPPVEIDDMEVDLLPSVDNQGFNDIGVYGFLVEPSDDDISDDPLLIVGEFGEPLDFGGSMPVYYPDTGSPVVDAGQSSFLSSGRDQRGLYYVREFGDAADIGAVEVQSAEFEVDITQDETDQVYNSIILFLNLAEPYQPGNVLNGGNRGDFSLREALEQSVKNPEVDTITFFDFRGDIFNPDVTVSPAPTILLTLGQLRIPTSVNIVGPETHILEIDASGNDPTPLVNNSDGSRVFQIDDASNTSFIDVAISGLAMLGGDFNGNGGAIFNRENLTLDNVSVRDSNTSGKGGGVYNQYGTLAISDSTLSGNRAADDGGGLFIDGVAAGPVVDIANSTFSGNSASDRGAGIGNKDAKLTVRYSTITANTSGSSFGSGVNNFGATSSTTFYSTIVSGNSSRDLDFYSTSGATLATITSQGYNFIGVTNAASKFNQAGDRAGTSFANPMLGALATTGGLTATHRPLVGSPVIDLGNPTDMAGAPAPEFDQRGPNFIRVFDGNFDGTARIDIGAYELQPTVLVVDSALDVSNGDYSMGNFTLREALEISNQNPLTDTIMFSPTLSLITVGGATSTTLPITDSVNIEGPGSENLAVAAAQVVLPAQLALADRMFTIDNGLPSFITVKISGLEIRDAQVGAVLSRESLDLFDITFINNRNTTSGGAVFHELAPFKIANSSITGNSTTATNADGGALYFRNVNGASKVEFDYTTISGNFTTQSGGDGGAIFFKNSIAEIRGVTISGNSTLAGTADGGGVYIDGSTVLFEESTVSGNGTIGANSEGAGMFINGATSVVTLTKESSINFNTTIGTQAMGAGAFVAGGTLNVENSFIAMNVTSGLGSHGAGIAMTGGTVNLSGATVQLNRATGLNSNGGGIANLSANLVIRDSTIVDNHVSSAGTLGGGIYSDTNLLGTQSTKIINSTISGNSATSRGGGLFNADGSVEIRHSTVTLNSTPLLNTGNGISSLGNASTRTIVESSIIAGNVGSTAGTGSDLDSVDAQFVNSFQSAGYNVVGTGNSLAAFNQPGDKTGILNPLLAPLSNNGGLVETHALLEGSPAVNSGKPGFNANSFSPALTTDERGFGFARVLGGRIDVGAFESSFTPFTADFDLDGDVDGGDFMVWQRFNGLMAGATKSKGDANGDGKVNSTDLSIWRSQVGAGGSGAAAPTSEGNASPAIAAAVVAAPEAGPAEPVATIAPLVTAVFDTVASSVNDAVQSSSPSSTYSSIASSGVPGATGARRPAYRPAPARGAAHDAVHSAIESRFAWRLPATAATLDSNDELDGDSSAEDESSDADAGDSIFALLGEQAF